MYSCEEGVRAVKLQSTLNERITRQFVGIAAVHGEPTLPSLLSGVGAWKRGGSPCDRCRLTSELSFVPASIHACSQSEYQRVRGVRCGKHFERWPGELQAELCVLDCGRS